MKLYLRNVKRVKLHTSPTAISNHKSNPNSNNIELEVNVKLTIKIKTTQTINVLLCKLFVWSLGKERQLYPRVNLSVRETVG